MINDILLEKRYFGLFLYFRSNKMSIIYLAQKHFFIFKYFDLLQNNLNHSQESMLV